MSTPRPERGESLREFVVDPQGSHAEGRLRQGAAIAGGMASGALLLARVPVAVFLVGAAGLLVAAAWWRKGKHHVAEAKQPLPDALWTYERGLLLRELGEERWIPWEGVQRVSIDEETLTIRLERGSLPPVTLEPRYTDTTIDELANALASAAGVAGPYDGSQSGGDDLQ